MNNVSFNGNVYAKNNNQVNFKGKLGDKFVSDIVAGKVVKPDEVMNAVKGTFGPKTEKVADVVESLLGKVQVLSQQGVKDAKVISDANAKLDKVPIQIGEAVHKREAELVKYYTETIAKKDEELANAKKFVEKYEPMAKVKSIEEIGIVMPDEVIKMADDMISHKVEARASMGEYLFNGKGQEKALEQIERNNVIQSAYENGTVNIPEVNDAITRMHENGLYSNPSVNYANALISRTLKGYNKATYLEIQPIREQVKQNAVSLLSSLEQKGDYHVDIPKMVDETIEDARMYHKDLARGKQKIEKRNPEIKVTADNYVPFDSKSSHIIITRPNGETKKISYDDLFLSGNYDN